jgi:hypothetical protein
MFKMAKSEKKSEKTLKKDAVSLASKLLDEIKSIIDFIVHYRKVSENQDAFSYQKNRMSVIQKGLQRVIVVFKDIEDKIAIWVSNDPQLEIDANSIEPSLVLTYVSRWPLFFHLGSAIFCFGFSAVFHLF